MDNHSEYGQWEEDADGLGYYPDGAKRTLTDEQIAMFRHSEIYGILRQRQLKEEKADSEQVSGEALERDRTDSSSGARSELPAEKLPGSQRPLSASQRSKRRRLRKNQDKQSTKSQELPSRREIRELDAFQGDDQMLEYD